MIDLKVGMRFKCVNNSGMYVEAGKVYEIASVSGRDVYIRGETGQTIVSVAQLGKKFILMPEAVMTQAKKEIYSSMASQYPTLKGFIYNCVLNDQLDRLYELLDSTVSELNEL